MAMGNGPERKQKRSGEKLSRERKLGVNQRASETRSERRTDKKRTWKKRISAALTVCIVGWPGPSALLWPPRRPHTQKENERDSIRDTLVVRVHDMFRKKHSITKLQSAERRKEEGDKEIEKGKANKTGIRVRALLPGGEANILSRAGDRSIGQLSGHKNKIRKEKEAGSCRAPVYGLTFCSEKFRAKDQLARSRKS